MLQKPSKVRRQTALRAAGLGAIAGVGGAVAAASVGPRRRVELGAVELAFIAGAYPAMAFRGAPRRMVATELVVSGAFLAWALAGLVHRSEIAIAAGLLTHGAWDSVHHRSRLGATVPASYPTFCLVADGLLALPLLLNSQRSAEPLRRRHHLNGR